LKGKLQSSAIVVITFNPNIRKAIKMAPKPDIDVIISNDASTMCFGSNGESSSMTGVPQNAMIRKYSDIPLYHTTNTQMQVQDLSNAMSELKVHYGNILNTVDASLSRTSPVLEACRLSLLTRTPLVMNQAESLIESLRNCGDSTSRLRDKLQASCTILRIAKYLDTIELAMRNPPRESLDEKLHSILQCTQVQLLQKEMEHDISFRISPWVPSCLAFDLPVGHSARCSVPGSHALNVEVEPVFEFHANDLLNGRNVIGSFQACRVEIEKIKHKPCQFYSGAGTIGECMIRIRLSPIANKSGRIPIWGEEPAVDELVVKEARA
jgi:hypothetical protein